MSNKLWYSWEEMRRDVNVLCRDIVLDKFDPEVIVGLSRGGLVPSVMMSHWFKKPLKPVVAAMRDFPEWEEYLPRPTDKRVLVVDDIVDTGKTLERLKPLMGPTNVIYTIYYHEQSTITPNAYVFEKKGDWVVFPWEEDIYGYETNN